MEPTRGLRVAGIAALVFGVLYLRFAGGMFPDNEVSPMIHWGLLPMALLFALGGWAAEVNATMTTLRRDALFGLSSGLTVFSLLRISGAI
jgi:hypothetical protein